MCDVVLFFGVFIFWMVWYVIFCVKMNSEVNDSMDVGVSNEDIDIVEFIIEILGESWIERIWRLNRER